jgi:hypothetical protein
VAVREIVETPKTRLTEFGFEWGPLKVTRISVLGRGILVELKTPVEELQVYVTATGRMRVFGRGGQWFGRTAALRARVWDREEDRERQRRQQRRLSGQKRGS